MLADERLVVALRFAVVLRVAVLLRLTVVAVRAAVLLVLLAVHCLAVLLLLAVVAVCVAVLLLLLSSFFIVKMFLSPSNFSIHWSTCVLRFLALPLLPNDVSLYKKRRVVLEKTTYHFKENDVSFCGERRQVFVFVVINYIVSVSSSPSM